MTEPLQIQVVASGENKALEIVYWALVRSFTATAVDRTRPVRLSKGSLLVLINPGDDCVDAIKHALSCGGKVLALGSFSYRVGELLGLTKPPDKSLCGLDTTEPCENQPVTQSSGVVRYLGTHSLAGYSILKERPFCRFDFMDEWNNLGYGRIRTDGSPWSVAGYVDAAGADVVANIELIGQKEVAPLGVYCTVKDYPNGAVLWFNRPVGPVDSHEWGVIEAFFSDYRADELACIPTLSEIPHDCTGVVTMRLDCDEAISSARPLFELYAGYQLPFSLAVKTSLPMATDDISLVRDVLKNEGGLLSHSHTHLRNWGNNYAEAFAEAQASKGCLEERFPRTRQVQCAVSPFHSNQDWSMQALCDAGYHGVVTGIIQDHPEYLIARGGQVPFVDGELVSHSQQCMLHGDCYRWQGHSVDVPLQSFENHMKAGAVFGYLDHPFSERYSYGWQSESERIEAHEKLIRHIRAVDGVEWVNEEVLLQRLFLRNRVMVRTERDGSFSVAGCLPETPRFFLKYRNQIHPL